MVMFARSDQLEVKCEARPGTSHVRPRRNPADPASDFIRVWGVDCPPCERGHLRDDPHWARSKHRIPLTPDEEEEGKRALADAARIQAQLELIRARKQAEEYRQLVAAGELDGLDDADIVITTAADTVADATGGPAVTATADLEAPYRALTKKDLQDLARDRDLPVTGTKSELSARLADFDQRAVAA